LFLKYYEKTGCLVILFLLFDTPSKKRKCLIDACVLLYLVGCL